MQRRSRRELRSPVQLKKNQRRLLSLWQRKPEEGLRKTLNPPWKSSQSFCIFLILCFVVVLYVCIFFLNLNRMLGTLSYSEIIINKEKIRQWIWVLSYFHLLCNALNNQVYADEVQRDCFAPDKEIPEGAQSPDSTPSTFPLVVVLWKPVCGWRSDVRGRGELVFDTYVEAGERMADGAAHVWSRGLCAFSLTCHLIRQRQKHLGPTFHVMLTLVFLTFLFCIWKWVQRAIIKS